ncbi:MAG: nucleotidyltransferase family protein [Eubacteriales bacterium]|nr:nucleotidyltransferase family protein [Eubacteriales bacterium]
MRASGIICEYNPFHNGHLAQLRMLRALGDDPIVLMMSGPFCQRGIPAVLDKFERAALAIRHGADLVFEIPCHFATASADYFAEGALLHLAVLPFVERVYCGSESCADDALNRAARLLANEDDLYREKLRDCLSRGLSYPRATAEALDAYFANPEGDRKTYQELLGGGNDLLALAYMRARYKHQLDFEIKLLKRLGNSGERDSESARSVAYRSASAIRRELLASSQSMAATLESVYHDLPPLSLASIGLAFQSKQLLFSRDLSLLIYDRLCLDARRLEDLNTLPEYQDGLAERCINEARSLAYKNEVDEEFFEKLVERVACKSYTKTRVRRALLHLILGPRRFIPETKLERAGYLRLLAMSRRGQYLLKRSKKSISLPIIGQASDFKNLQDEVAKSWAELDLDADNLALALRKRAIGRDYRQTPLMLKAAKRDL